MDRIRVPERRSRRTHKNSRDGCPNCKAKRIKCLEELPQCLNCVKKKYRCGYLDFPKEKLHHLRIKNENRRQEEMFLKLRKEELKSSSSEDSEIAHASHKPRNDYSSISSNSTLNSVNSNRLDSGSSANSVDYVFNSSQYSSHNPKDNLRSVFVNEAFNETYPDNDKIELAYDNLYQVDPQEQEQFNQLQQLYHQYSQNQIHQHHPQHSPHPQPAHSLQPPHQIRHFESSPAPTNHSSVTPVSSNCPPPPQQPHPPFAFPNPYESSPVAYKSCSPSSRGGV